ncbi:ribonuclease H-like YkuK family protein [Patescibacteria group bacterium]
MKKGLDKYLFINPSRGQMTPQEMIGEIAGFIDEEPTEFYRVVIGTDSQTRSNNGKTQVDYVTAIIVHRKGRGGKYYWRKEKKYKVPVLREKIYTETQMSLELAQEIVPEIRRVVSPAKYDLQIHIDVGALGPTREMIKEVVGMVNGNGFTAKTKPESWGASSVADKHA